MLSLTTILVLLVVWILLLSLLGFLVTRSGAGRRADEYLTAGHGVHYGVVTTSIVAAYVAAVSLMGSAEGAYTYGAAGLYIYGGIYGAGLIVFGFGARHLRKLLPRGTTVHQFVRLRFDGKTEIFWSLLTISFAAIIVMQNLIGTGIVIELFTGAAFPFWIGPILMTIAVLVYMLGAGMWSSLIADYLMLTIVAGSTVVLVPSIVGAAGGLDTIFAAFQERAAEESPGRANFFDGDAMINYLVSVAAWSFLTIWLQQEHWLKAFTVDSRYVRRCFLIAGVWWACMPILTCIVGFSGWALGVEVDLATNIYPAMVVEYLPTWSYVVFLIMIFAAVTSTTAAALLAVTSTTTVNLYASHINRGASERRIRKITPMILLVAAAVCTVFSLNKISLLELLLFMALLLAAPAPALLMGMLNSRLTPNGAFFSSLSGMIVALYIYFAPYLGAANVLSEGVSGNLGYGIIFGAATSLLLALLSITFWNHRFDFEPLRRAGEIDELAEGRD